MKSATSGSTCRRSSCAPFRRGRSSASAARNRSRRTSGSWLRPTSISRRQSKRAGSATILLPDQRHPDSMPPASGSRSPALAKFFFDRVPVEVPETDPRHPESTMKLLLSYWWPGNIRELENLIERLVAVGDKEWITDEDLPLTITSRGSTRRRPPEREPVPGGVRHVRAEHHPRARTQRLERLRDRPLSWHSA